VFLENLFLHLACNYCNILVSRKTTGATKKELPYKMGWGLNERNYKEGVSEKTQLLVPENLQYINSQNYATRETHDWPLAMATPGAWCMPPITS